MPLAWSRVTELFHAALDRPASQRRAFLDEACAGNEGLRDEVLSLVNAHDSAGDFLGRPAVAPADLEADPGVELVGTTVGSYLVERELGRGGMGVVYLASDTRLGRKVALKALPQVARGDLRRRERLRREARAAAALSHPGIATVYALEEIGDDLYIASEYVQGETLRSRLAGGPLPMDTALRLAISVAGALDAAHASGIVHRDLKPENVIVTPDERVKVLDFGIAFMGAAESSPGEPRLTETGAVLGTPSHMSPEQIEGRAVDFRSDQFAFGVLLYEMLTGANPFGASTPLAAAARVVAAEAPPLSDAVPDAPPELERVLRRCLAKRPDERYARTAELLNDLARVSGARQAAASALSPDALSSVPPNPVARRWWLIHQGASILIYSSVVFAMWEIKDWLTGLPGRLILLLYIGGAVVNGILRLHLLFLSRFGARALPAQVRRTRGWVVWSDTAVAAALLVSCIDMFQAHPRAAAALTALAVGIAAVSVWVEPATIEAAFPGALRRKPTRDRLA